MRVRPEMTGRVAPPGRAARQGAIRRQGTGLRRLAWMSDPADGFTLVEIMVVVLILVILIAALGFEFTKWRSRYFTEAQLKELYVDLSNARVKAMETRRIYFVNMPSDDPGSYRVFVDNSPAPDGDGVLDETKDTKMLEKRIRYRFITQLNFFGFTKSGLMYNSSGMIESPRWVRIVREDYVAGNIDTYLAADMDCLEAVSTRINLGLFSLTGNTCEGR